MTAQADFTFLFIDPFCQNLATPNIGPFHAFYMLILGMNAQAAKKAEQQQDKASHIASLLLPFLERVRIRIREKPLLETAMVCRVILERYKMTSERHQNGLKCDIEH
jgi:hypothetical protein